jgi:hypothetical protein
MANTGHGSFASGRTGLWVLAVALLFSIPSFGQEISLASLLPPTPPAATANVFTSAEMAVHPVMQVAVPRIESEHKFLDKENCLLFVAVIGLSSADFAATRMNLSNGGHESNPLARMFTGSTAGQVINFEGGAATAIGLSYVFHKTGHHNLERMASLVQIGSSGIGFSYSLSHR